MAISPASLVSSAAFLQDIKNTQTNKIASQENKDKESAFKRAIDGEQAQEKQSSVAVEIKTEEASQTSRRVDIKVADDEGDEKNQEFRAVAAKREAPLATHIQNQRPGSNLDISV